MVLKLSPQQLSRDKEEDRGYSKPAAAILRKEPSVKHLVSTLIPVAFLCNYLLAASAEIRAGNNSVSFCWQQDTE